MSDEKREGRYARVIVVLSFLMIFTGLGFASSTRSLFLAPITEELGFDRGLYSLSDTIRFVVTAVVNLFFGALVSRFGTRRLIGAGFLSLTLAALICSFSHHILLFYLSGALFGIGFSFTATTMVGTVITRWCPGRRGTVMGAILAANGLGGATATQIVTPVIHSGAGWRAAYLVLSAILFTVGAVIVIFFRDRAPADVPPSAAKGEDGAGNTPMAPGVRFYLLCACIVVTGFSLQGMTGVAAAHMGDVGISSEWIATALSVHMVVLTVSKFLTGFLYDKLGLRAVVIIDVSGAILTAVILSMVTSGTLGILMALLYGVTSALALPLETVMLPLYAREFFDPAQYGRRLGLLVSVNTAGYALGSPCLNLIYDLTGKYHYGFLLCIALMAGALVTLMCLITYRKRELAAR